MHETRSGGRHLFFLHRPGLRCSTSKIERGIDVRADGGLVIWWPAQFYPVREAPVATWPDWLLETARAAMHKRDLAKNKKDGPLVAWQPSGDYRTIPKPLYTKMLDLMPKARLRDQRRVRGILSMVVEKHEGRNDALNIAAYCLRELIANGVISRDAAEDLLIEAATLNGYVAKDGLAAAMATIRSGLGSPATGGPSFQEEEAP
jgi:hypothetical protein